jgi:hypothetical protein
MNYLLLISCLAISFLAHSQKKTTQNPADRYVQQIDARLKSKELSAKSLDHMSATGGSVTGFYSDGRLALIYTVYSGEHGYRSYNYYLRHDSLLLVQETQVFWKLSTEEDYERFEAYRQKHTDKEGVTDLSDWPMEIDDNNRYYFHDTVIVDFKIRSFKKARGATEDEIAETNKELLRRLRIHCKELEYKRSLRVTPGRDQAPK